MTRWAFEGRANRDLIDPPEARDGSMAVVVRADDLKMGVEFASLRHCGEQSVRLWRINGGIGGYVGGSYSFLSTAC